MPRPRIWARPTCDGDVHGPSGNSGRIQARELYLEFVPMDLDSDETSRDINTAVLHRISISFIWAERFGLGSHF